MKITFKTDNKDIVGVGKYSLTTQMKVRQSILKVVNQLIQKYKLSSLNEVVVYKLKDCKTELGRVYKTLNNKIPKTVLYISDLSVTQIMHGELYSQGYHTFHHEVCHIKDFEAICEYMNGELVSDGYKHPYTINSVFLTTGYGMFGEYIAYKNCYNTYDEKFENCDFDKKCAKYENIAYQLSYIQKQSIKIKDYIFNQTIKDINKILYFICKYIGYYHASGNTMFLSDLTSIKNNNLINFVYRVEEKLKSLNDIYPSCISYDNYVDVGRLFLSLFDGYDLHLVEEDGHIFFKSS